MKYYYVFLLLDGVPFLEFFLDEEKIAIDDYKQIMWENIKYIILEFKTNLQKNEMVQKGTIKNKNIIITNQIIYYEINVKASHQAYNNKKNIPKKYDKLIKLSEKLFFSNPENFLQYIEELKLFPKNEIKKYYQALEKMKEEQRILNSWHHLKEK